MPPKGEKRVAPISSSAFSFSLNTPAKKKQVITTTTASSVASPLRRKADTSTTTPLRTPVRPVSDLHARSPLFASTEKNKHETNDNETPKKRQQTLPSHANFLLPPKSAPHAESPKRGPERRISDVLDGSPFHAKAPTPLSHAITAPQAVAVRERARVIEVGEGVGVSPRKFKGNIQYKGPGPPPSVRLATLLSSSNTAMVLFYTSLQHSVRGFQVPNPAGRHLRSAPVRLEVDSVVGGRTHAAVMLRCTVRQWPSNPAPDTLLVVLQALPCDCPLVGVDPRVVAAGKRYEVGLWTPWTEGPAMGGGGGGGGGGGDTVVFASRYLIAEAEG